MKWIHVSEQLPPIEQEVLFCCYEDEYDKFSEVRIGWYEGTKPCGNAVSMETVHGEPGWWFPCEYWMPLSELPSPRAPGAF